MIKEKIATAVIWVGMTGLCLAGAAILLALAYLIYSIIVGG